MNDIKEIPQPLLVRWIIECLQSEDAEAHPGIRPIFGKKSPLRALYGLMHGRPVILIHKDINQTLETTYIDELCEIYFEESVVGIRMFTGTPKYLGTFIDLTSPGSMQKLRDALTKLAQAEYPWRTV